MIAEVRRESVRFPRSPPTVVTIGVSTTGHRYNNLTNGRDEPVLGPFITMGHALSGLFTRVDRRRGLLIPDEVFEVLLLVALSSVDGRHVAALAGIPSIIIVMLRCLVLTDVEF